MAEYITDKIEYGGNVYTLQDNVSGYTSNAGTITRVKTTAGTHTAVDVSSGQASFNVPTNTSHLTNDSGFVISPNVVYATCSTASSTAAKTATIVSGTLTSLNTGDQVIVKFTNANGKASPTLKVGNTDAKSIMRYGTTAPSTSASSSWNAGSCVLFIYDGTYWQMAGWVNTTYSEISEANITSGTGSTSGLVTGRRAKKAVETFESVSDVTVNGTSVVSSKTAAITVTDEKLKTEAITSGALYYPVLATGANDGTVRQVDTTGLSYTAQNINYGEAGLSLGNNVVGTSGGKYGSLTIYSGSQYGAKFKTGSAFAADRTITIQDKSGTIALTSDVDGRMVKPENNDDAVYGYILRCVSPSSTYWEPETMNMFYVLEDEDNPGTFNVSGATHDYLMLGLYGAPALTATLVDGTEYVLTNCRRQHYEYDIDGRTIGYTALWFSGTHSYLSSGASGAIRTKTILARVYINDDEYDPATDESVAHVDIIDSAIGDKLTGTRTGTSSVGTSYVTIASLTLSPGSWIIHGYNSFNGGTAGRRAILITSNYSATYDAAEGSSSTYAAASQHCCVQSMLPVTIDATTTYYLRAKSGTTVDSPEGNLTAMRIA